MKKIRHFLLFLVLIVMNLLFIIIFAHSQRSGVGIFINIFGADTAPPKINITKLLPTSIGNITLTGTYSDESVLANMTIEFNSSYKVRASFNTALKTWSTPANLSEGWNKFYVLAYDALGNFVNVTSSSQGASVLLDTTKPAINLTSPQNESLVANNSLIAFKISDLSLADAFYTINNGTTTSFNSVYELRPGTSDWVVNEINHVIVNATDSTNNVERKNFTFTYSNIYAVVLNNSIITSQAVINNTNETINNLQDSAAIQSLVNNFAAAITVNDYNKTLQVLNVVSNLSNAVNSVQSLLQEILDANSSSQTVAAKIETINAKLEEISSIKNTTIASVDIILFNPNLTVAVGNATKNNVTNQILATVAGLSAAEEQSFRDASAALQNKTTIINKVQTLTQTFLNGRTENVTLFEKNVSLSEAQSGQFYVNEFIDKNITGNNDLNANTDVINTVPQPMTVVVADPTVRWTFSDTESGVIGYVINSNVPSDKVSESQTVVTTVPTAAGAGTTTSGGGTSGGVGTAGGGGGGPATLIITDFSIDKTTLKVVLKQGQTKTETLTIKNTGTTIFDIKAILDEIEKFKIHPKENEITTLLQPNEEKTIEIVFQALENEIPDIYPAKIKLKSPSVEKEIDAVIEVDSAEPLFDVDVEVLPESKSVFPGDELLLEVNLFNVRGFGRVDVGVEYAIKDFKGNIVATEHETLAVETQAKFSRSLLVPSDLRPGNYVALVKVTYGESIGTSSDIFEVKAKAIRLLPIQIKDYRVILLIGGAVVLVGILIFSAYKFGYLKKKAPVGKIEGIKQFKEEEKAQKMRKELDALEQARKSGFISEESYQRDKKRIEDKLKSLK